MSDWKEKLAELALKERLLKLATILAIIGIMLSAVGIVLIAIGVNSEARLQLQNMKLFELGLGIGCAIAGSISWVAGTLITLSITKANKENEKSRMNGIWLCVSVGISIAIIVLGTLLMFENTWLGLTHVSLGVLFLVLNLKHTGKGGERE